MVNKIYKFFTLVLFMVLIASNITKADENLADQATKFATIQAEEVAKVAKSSSQASFVKYLNNKADDTLAVGYMGLWALGQNGKLFTGEQKDRYIKVFKEYLINFYGNVLYQNKDSKFTYSKTTLRGNNIALVEFNAMYQGQSISIVWEIRKSSKDNRLLITDFVVNGISFLQAKRSEYAALIKADNNDVDKFINDIQNYNQQAKSLKDKAIK
ncbi:phospholipid-binding protein MlaC [Rickettsiales bacterium LUAb2]